MNEPKLTAAIAGLDTKTPEQIKKWLTETVLPERIGGWVPNDLSTDSRLPILGFVQDENKKDDFYEIIADGTNQKYTQGAQWGSVAIDEWVMDNIPNSFEDGDIVVIRANIKKKIYNNVSYQMFVNSNDPKDYQSGSKGSDTRSNPEILNLTITLKNIDLSDHTVPAANPENVTVNLFDYWVREQTPSSPKGDILDKSDRHYHEDGDEEKLSTTSTGYSTDVDWNQGINKKHLLLFGDGMIHAGLWNKGAGENCRYGNTYAGMEGIVKNTLPENGYPELNLAMANKILTDGNPKREETLIKDWKLAGNHKSDVGADGGYTYDSDNIKNLSDTVIQTWGGDITADTESLRYLFDPEDSSATFKKSYTDVKGLFQLDNKGYYYYNMRENFAEFVEGKESDGNNNHFILYDAPAALRTDAEQSVGNFFPFNKGSEVFNGMDDKGNLTSTVACSGNSMNHSAYGDRNHVIGSLPEGRYGR